MEKAVALVTAFFRGEILVSKAGDDWVR